MKTVKDLIEFLNTKNQDLPVTCQYDGMSSYLHVFEYAGKLVFTESTLNADYREAEIEFTSEEKQPT